jgi:hypothetical protein
MRLGCKKREKETTSPTAPSKSGKNHAEQKKHAQLHPTRIELETTAEEMIRSVINPLDTLFNKVKHEKLARNE